MLNKQKRLIIVGAGDFAREILWAAQDIALAQQEWSVAGFIDDNPEAAQQRLSESGVTLPVLGGITKHEPEDDAVYVPGIASPRAKLKLCEALQARGARFINLIHPTAAVGPGASLGVGIVLWRHAVVSVNATVGDFVTLQNHAGLGHDVLAGSGVTLSGYAEVLGHAVLERGAFLGSHAIVLQRKKVGEFATVGAGSVAIRNVPPNVTVFGSPARILTSQPG